MIHYLQHKTHIIFWLSTPILLILISSIPDSAFDLQLHDVYFLIAPFHMAIFIVYIIMLIGFIYWSLRNYRLIKWMKVTHCLLTILPIIVISILLIVHQNLNNFVTSNLINSNFDIVNEESKAFGKLELITNIMSIPCLFYSQAKSFLS